MSEQQQSFDFNAAAGHGDDWRMSIATDPKYLPAQKYNSRAVIYRSPNLTIYRPLVSNGNFLTDAYNWA